MRKQRPTRGAVPVLADKAGARLTARELPALRAFLRGYLHEDFPEEHGSHLAAVAAFCRDATLEERQQLAADLAAVVEAGSQLPAAALRRAIGRDLGSGWVPRSVEDFADMLSLVRAAS